MATTMTSLDDDGDFETGGGSRSVQRPDANGAAEDDERAAAEASGVIIPPRDLRAVADKTASFVARNPPEFEDRIRENERANPKFSFLNPRDPYHAYYQMKLKRAREGKFDAAPDAPAAAVPDAPGGEKVKEPPKEPAPFEFVLPLPNISAQDLDVLLHTAQFTARNGRQFLTSLAQRESRNSQFDFLRPNHSLFPYFTKMVEQYTKVLIPGKEQTAKLEDNSADVFKIMERVMTRVEWKLYDEERKRQKEEEEDAERLAFAEIDWHDFVVVETVEFTEADELLPLPPPTNKADLESMSLAQKNAALVVNVGGADAVEEDGEGEMEMDEDEDDRPPVRPAAAGAPAPVMPPPPPAMVRPPPMPGMMPPPMPPPARPMMPPPMPMPGRPFPAPPLMMPPPIPGAFPRPGMPGMPPIPPPPFGRPPGFHPRDETPEDAEAAKRRKLLEEGITIQIETAKVPDKSAEWGLDGSTFPLEAVHPSMTVGQIKEKIQQAVKMPSGRQKLSTAAGVVMKNTSTLASYNIKAGDKLMLDVRAK
ncbi:Pre-mRNA splicing factor PRP21 like protein-domain-containing protein [Hyaloraphidium curvatum]|nr:Pre-mRNA splicing factor PRP21 like protein-domain-containing protein [Hyaloraphidium curvatum]